MSGFLSNLVRRSVGADTVAPALDTPVAGRFALVDAEPQVVMAGGESASDVVPAALAPQPGEPPAQPTVEPVAVPPPALQSLAVAPPAVVQRTVAPNLSAQPSVAVPPLIPAQAGLNEVSPSAGPPLDRQPSAPSFTPPALPAVVNIAPSPAVEPRLTPADSAPDSAADQARVEASAGDGIVTPKPTHGSGMVVERTTLERMIEVSPPTASPVTESSSETVRAGSDASPPETAVVPVIAQVPVRSVETRPEERTVHVRIGTIEIRAATPVAANQTPAPAQPARHGSGGGFDEYARLRRHAPWTW